MATTVFNFGLDSLAEWEVDTYRFMLVNSGYVVNRDNDFVSSVVANELSGVGYARYTITVPTRTVDDTLDRIVYGCEDPNFGNIAIGETADAMILYKFVTNDAASPLIAHYPLGGVPTTGAAFIVAISAAGAALAAQG